MNEPERGWTDQQVEQFLGDLLRYGVILAAAVVLAGGVLYLRRDGGGRPELEKFKSEPQQLRELPGVVADALTLDGRGVIQFGLLLLIAVPVARVAFSVFAFALQRDRVYVVVTVLVLAVLLFSLLAG